MLTEPDDFFETLRRGLLGHAVSFRRLAGDSLLLYIECEPGDPSGITLWLEPVWHLRGPGGGAAGLNAGRGGFGHGGRDGGRRRRAPGPVARQTDRGGRARTVDFRPVRLVRGGLRRFHL